MDNKGFHHYGTGVVVKDKLEDSYVIEVFPVEKLGNLSIDLDSTDSFKSMITDSNKKNILLEATKAYTIRPAWVARGQSNRVTAPDVVQGETVEILKYGDSDNFYWDTLFTELDLRRTENVTYLFGNTDEKGVTLNAENSYYLNITTKGKNIILHTSDNDGELCTYDIQLNTKKGKFSLLDGRKNYFELDSAKDKFKAKTNKSIELETKKVQIDCDEYILNCKTSMVTATNSWKVSTLTSLIGASVSHTINSPASYGSGTFSSAGKIHSNVNVTTNYLLSGVNDHHHKDSLGGDCTPAKN